MTEEINQLLRFKNKKDSVNFQNKLLESIVKYGVSFFYKSLVKNVLLNPVSEGIESDVDFLRRMSEIPDQYSENQQVIEFHNRQWLPWCFLFIKVSAIFTNIKMWLKENGENNKYKIIEYSIIQISKKLETDRKKIIQEYGHASTHSSNISSGSGDVSFYEEEHHLIDSLDILVRHLSYQEKPSKRNQKIIFKKWNDFFLLCQLWMSWLSLWNRVKLGEYRLCMENNEYFLKPIDEKRYLRAQVGKFRTEERIKEIAYTGAKYMSEMFSSYRSCLDEYAGKKRISLSNLPYIFLHTTPLVMRKLIKKREAVTISERVLLNIAFHEVDFSHIKFEYDVNLEDLVLALTILNIISEIAQKTITNRNISKIPNAKLVFKFSKSDWKHLVGDSLENSEEILKLLTYSKERTGSLDIWCTPFINQGADNYIVLPHVLKAISHQYLIEQFLNTYNADVNGRLIGKAFEEEVRTELKSIPSGKLYHGKTDGFEFDSLFLMDNYWFIVESKRTATISSSHDRNRANVRMMEGVKQVKLRKKYLLSEKGQAFIKNEFKGSFRSLPNNSNIIEIVCMSLFDLSGQTVDGVTVTDLNLLRRFLKNDKDTFEVSNLSKGSVDEKYEIPTRSTGKIIKKELIEFLENPHQITLVEGAYTFKESIIPFSLSKKEDIKILNASFSVHVFNAKRREFLKKNGVEFDEDLNIL